MSSLSTAISAIPSDSDVFSSCKSPGDNIPPFVQFLPRVFHHLIRDSGLFCFFANLGILSSGPFLLYYKQIPYYFVKQLFLSSLTNKTIQVYYNIQNNSNQSNNNNDNNNNNEQKNNNQNVNNKNPRSFYNCDYTFYPSVCYNKCVDNSTQTIDLFIPKDFQYSIKPHKNGIKCISPIIILFVAGGGWGSGNSYFYRLFCSLFSSKSPFNYPLIVGSINYRIYPFGCIQQQLEDIHKSILFLSDKQTIQYYYKKHINIHHNDINDKILYKPNIYLCGHSSGSHLISLYHLLYNQHFKNSNSFSNFNLNGIINLAGIFNLYYHSQYYEKERRIHQISPLRPNHIIYSNNHNDKYHHLNILSNFSPSHSPSIPHITNSLFSSSYRPSFSFTLSSSHLNIYKDYLIYCSPVHLLLQSLSTPFPLFIPTNNLFLHGLNDHTTSPLGTLEYTKTYKAYLLKYKNYYYANNNNQNEDNNEYLDTDFILYVNYFRDVDHGEIITDLMFFEGKWKLIGNKIIDFIKKCENKSIHNNNNNSNINKLNNNSQIIGSYL